MLEESHAVQWGHLQALAGRDLAVELGGHYWGKDHQVPGLGSGALPLPSRCDIP